MLAVNKKKTNLTDLVLLVVILPTHQNGKTPIPKMNTARFDFFCLLLLPSQYSSLKKKVKKNQTYRITSLFPATYHHLGVYMSVCK